MSVSSSGNGHPPGAPKLVLCPSSLEQMQGIGDGYALHYANPNELRKFGGVCAKCFGKFRRRNIGALEGKTETPATFDTLHQVRDEATEHFAYEGHSAIVQTIEFDHSAVQRHADGEPEPGDAHLPTLADGLRAVLAWCWSDWQLSRRPESAFRKFVAMSATINPSLLHNLPFKQLGELFGGVTRAAFSKASLQFQDEFGIKASRSFSKEARASCRKARLKKIQSK